jgi:hypothetical protein
MWGRRHAALAAAVLGVVMLVAAPAAPSAGAKHGHRHHHRQKPKLVVGPDNLVAPLTIPANPHPGPVPYCSARKATVKCVQTALHRLRDTEAALGCDHRAVFATTYRVLTRAALNAVQANPHIFTDPTYFYREDALFVDVFIANTKAAMAGKRVSPAWQTANQEAASGDLTAAQDMLLGINAHVQNDMAFVIAALGTQPIKGGLSYQDHEVFNDTLASAYQDVVSEVQRRYDPSVGLTNPNATTLDDYAGLQLVKQWREDVWTHANQLIAAKTPAERAQVTNQIEQNAQNWAVEITTAGAGVPGYRAQRDAYCAAHNPDA